MYEDNDCEVKELVAGILTIGDEVLDGIVLDTNSNWIEQRLAALGVVTRRQLTVRDDIKEIGNGLHFIRQDCNLVFTSGGLGPTHDDMTLLAISKAFNLPLEGNKDALDIVKRQYTRLHERDIVQSPDLTESRRKMARIPSGSVPLDNEVGGAPGVMIDYEETTYFILPGVPSELKAIFQSSVQPWVKIRSKLKYCERIVVFPHRDESVFAPVIDDVMKTHKGVYIKSMPTTYGTTNVLRVWVSARGPDENEVQEMVSTAIASLEEVSGLQSTPAPE
ncbi:MAG: competence/damage-inducible protein A [Candidatus Thorarchaeota archaeon]